MQYAKGMRYEWWAIALFHNLIAFCFYLRRVLVCYYVCFSKRVREVVTYLVQLKSGTIRIPIWVSSHRIQKFLFYLFIHRLGHRCAASFDDLAHRCINYPILIFNEVMKFIEILSMGWESNFKSSKRYISNNIHILYKNVGPTYNIIIIKYMKSNSLYSSKLRS